MLERREFKFTRIVQIPLPDDYAEQKVNYLVDMPEMAELLRVWTENGYTVSLAYDFKRDHAYASLFGKKTKGNNGGLMLYANAPTSKEALEILYVKHFLLAEGEDWMTAEREVRSKYS